MSLVASCIANKRLQEIKNRKPLYSSRCKNKYTSNHSPHYHGNFHRNRKSLYSSRSKNKYTSNHNTKHQPSYSQQSQDKYASDNYSIYHRNHKSFYSSQSQDKYASDNCSNYHRNHKSSTSSIPKNTFSIDPTYFSTTGIHTKKSRIIGPNLSDADYRSDSVPIERNIDYNSDPSKIVNGKKIPVGASIEEYEIIRACNRRWNVNIPAFEYQFVTAQANENGEQELKYWWSSYYQNALPAVVEFEEYNALKAIVQDYEFHLGLQRVQNSKPKFKVKINYSKSKSTVEKHYEKWIKKKQRRNSKKKKE